MKSTPDEVFGYRDRLLIHFYSLLLKVLINSLWIYLGSTFVGETFGVPVFGIFRFHGDRCVVILMRQIVLPLVQKYITSVEVSPCIIGLLFNRLIKIFLCKVILSYMIVSQSTIIVMERMLFEGNRLSEFSKSLVVFLFLKI